MLVLMAACAGSKAKHLSLGEQFLEQRKYHQALMEFRIAAEIDHESSEAYWGLARAYEKIGQFSETIDALRKTTQLAPSNAPAKIKLGSYFLLIQPPMADEAEKLAGEVLTADANSVDARILMASVMAARNRPEADVVKVLDGAIALDPARTDSYISKARYFMSLEKGQAAEEEIKEAIAANPKSALGWTEYGQFLVYANRAGESEEKFLKAIEIEPTSVDAREAIADFYTDNGDFDKAEKVFREIVRILGNSEESRIELAEFFARTARAEQAISVLDEIIAGNADFVSARYRLAEIRLDRGEYDKVNEQLSELLALNDHDAEALLLRARLSVATNRPDAAIRDLDEVLKKSPTEKDALFLMVEARLASGQSEQARAFIGDLERFHPNFLKTNLLKIQAAFADGDYDAAFRLSDSLFKTANGTVASNRAMSREISELKFRALSARGLANLDLGKLPEARADLTEIQKSAPRSSAALVNLAKVATAEKSYDESLKLYDQALALDARNYDALSGAVAVFNRLKKFGESHSKVDAVLANVGEGSEMAAGLHYLKADIFIAEGKTENAEAELKRAIEIDPAYLPAYSSYAAVLVDRGQTDAALEQYRAANAKAESPAIYTLIGILEESREKYAEAEKNYRKALELAPGSPIAANNLAWLIADRGQGNLDEALTLSQQVVNKYSKTAGYYDTLGWVYFKKGLFSPAVEQFKKAVALDDADAKRTGAEPNSAYRLRLATALASSGDKDSARREAEASLRNPAGLSDQEAQSAKTLLANL